MSTNPRIFISYKRDDKETVFQIKDYIENNVGEPCWIDLDGIESDAQFVNVIIKAINNAQVFLFMYSATHAKIENLNLQNDWTIKEISFAQKKNKRIVFINIDGTPLTDWFEFSFGTKQQLDASSDKAMEKLCDDLRKWLSIEKTEDRQDTVPKESPKTIVSGNQYTVELGEFSFDMIRVEGGEMMFGATPEQGEEAENNEQPAHKASVQSFYIGQFPVTQNIWEYVMGYNKSRFHDKKKELVAEKHDGMVETDQEPSSSGTNKTKAPLKAMAVLGMGMISPLAAITYEASKLLKRESKTNQSPTHDPGLFPAETLSYDETREFIRRLSIFTNIQFDLPTEQEWEYAARGGRKSQGYKYAGSNDINEVAWYKDNAENSTHPVGLKKPNELGIYDMSGNVWEWTKTPAHSYLTNVIESTTFIRRGGSWHQEATNCRVSRRYASNHSKKTGGLGFRLVIRENII